MVTVARPFRPCLQLPTVSGMTKWSIASFLSWRRMQRESLVYDVIRCHVTDCLPELFSPMT